MYKTIVSFSDTEDGGHVYNVGDTYPRKGAETTEARTAMLASYSNRLGRPLIAKQEKPEKKAKNKQANTI